MEQDFLAASLPLVRIPVKPLYSVTEMSKLLQPYLKITEPSCPARVFALSGVRRAGKSAIYELGPRMQEW